MTAYIIGALSGLVGILLFEKMWVWRRRRLIDPIVKALIERDDAANDALLALSCDLSNEPEDAPIHRTPLFYKGLQVWREAYEKWAALVKEANER